MADLQFVNHGSIVLCYPSSDAGREWVDEHLSADDVICWGDGIAIEPRYVAAIVEGATGDGLTCAEA